MKHRKRRMTNGEEKSIRGAKGRENSKEQKVLLVSPPKGEDRESQGEHRPLIPERAQDTPSFRGLISATSVRRSNPSQATEPCL